MMSNDPHGAHSERGTMVFPMELYERERLSVEGLYGERTTDLS